MREMFKFSREGSGGDYLEVTDEGRFVSFEIDSPWSGDTESGFGARLNINLPPDAIVDLHKALGDWLQKQPHTSRED